MKKLTTLAATLLISTSVFANTQVMQSDKSFATDSFTDKSEAYQAGFDYLDSLKTLSDAQLKHKLLVSTRSPVTDISIEKSKVSVEEFAQNRGEIAYRAIIDVDYNYTTINSDN